MLQSTPLEMFPFNVFTLVGMPMQRRQFGSENVSICLLTCGVETHRIDRTTMQQVKSHQKMSATEFKCEECLNVASIESM